MGNYQDTKNRYIKEQTDEVKLYLPKGQKAVIKALIDGKYRSINAFIVEAVREKIERETEKG